MTEELIQRERDDMLRQVSSQLREPLGGIFRALDRLAPPDRRDGDPALDQDAAQLFHGCCRILRLASNLAGLDGTAPLRLVNGDIIGLCRETAVQAEQPAQLLGLELEFRTSRSSHLIAIDSLQIERLLLNLLSNAFKFTPPGGSVVLEVRVEKEWVRLAVSDTGRGISPEMLETIFDRFQCMGRMEPPPHGLGLGLPLCRRIAQDHGGSLVLTSTEGAGTTVTVSLPNRKGPAWKSEGVAMEPLGGYNRILVELSDALPKEAFAQRFWD